MTLIYALSQAFFVAAGIAAWTIVASAAFRQLIARLHAHIDQAPFDVPEPPPADDQFVDELLHDIEAQWPAAARQMETGK